MELLQIFQIQVSKSAPEAWLVSMRICVCLEGLCQAFPERGRTICQDQQLYTFEVAP